MRQSKIAKSAPITKISYGRPLKTEILTPEDAIEVLNENLDGLLSGERKVTIVKEVNNTVGKILDVHKLEAISKNLSSDKTSLTWFSLTKTNKRIR